MKKDFYYESFTNGELNDFVQWKDTNGNEINASDGGIIYADGKYYWYGMALRPLPVAFKGEGGQTTTTGVVMYSSTDLYNWSYERVILPCSTDINSELYAPMRFERPKILFNDKTNQFVLWCHYVQYPGDHTNAFGGGEAGVAVCDKVNGEYKWLGHTRPINDEGVVRDCTAYKSPDGTAYFIYDRDVNDNRCLYVVKLSDDYLSMTNTYQRVSAANRREAASIFYYKNYYYIFTSELTGWTTNQAKLYRTQDLLKPWEDLGDPCIKDENHTTFESQSTYVFPVAEKNDLFIHMAERHNTNNFENCSYIWLPIKIIEEKKTAQLNYYPKWKIADF